MLDIEWRGLAARHDPLDRPSCCRREPATPPSGVHTGRDEAEDKDVLSRLLRWLVLEAGAGNAPPRPGGKRPARLGFGARPPPGKYTGGDEGRCGDKWRLASSSSAREEPRPLKQVRHYGRGVPGQGGLERCEGLCHFLTGVERCLTENDGVGLCICRGHTILPLTRVDHVRVWVDVSVASSSNIMRRGAGGVGGLVCH